MADYDVVGVGAGTPCRCAAVTASEAGASVLVAEASDAAGGASQFSAGLIMAAGTRVQRERGIEDSPEALLFEYLAFNRWSVETGVARRLAEEAGPTVEWLADHGAGVSDVYFSGDDRVARGHVMDGGGEAIVACLLAAAKADPRIDLAFGRRGGRVLTGSGGGGGGRGGDRSVPGGRRQGGPAHRPGLRQEGGPPAHRLRRVRRRRLRHRGRCGRGPGHGRRGGARGGRVRGQQGAVAPLSPTGG